MNRLATSLLLACISAAFVACSAADTSPSRPDATPTPTPEALFSNETYSKALKTVSLRLRGISPPIADTQDVLANGKTAYHQYVESYLSSSNNRLGTSLRDFYRVVFMMGDTFDGVNYDQVPNLAAYLVLNDRPVTELLTAEYCVGNGFSEVGCTEGAPAGQRAGIIGNQAFLKKFGEPSTVNMRRISVVHQLFACDIYPDGDEVAPLVRTNTDPATWPNNNGGTPDDPSDDFPDPQLAPFADDPAGPDLRLHKKFQTKLPTAAGAKCHDCHGQLNARRPIFTFYDEEGHYDPARSIGLSTTDAGEHNVESPEVNGMKDYCGVIGDTDLVTPSPTGNVQTDDDMDNTNSYDCSAANPTAIYLGQQVNTLKEFGAVVLQHDRFYSCWTTRHYNFALGKSQGDLSMQAGSGETPTPPSPDVLNKYIAIYESTGWNTREFWEIVFKSTEFLSTQGQPVQ